MDAGASHPSGFFRKLNRKRRVMNYEQRNFVKLLAQRQFKAVRSILDVMNEVDIASLLSDLEDKELSTCFSSHSKG